MPSKKKSALLSFFFLLYSNVPSMVFTVLFFQDGPEKHKILNATWRVSILPSYPKIVAHSIRFDAPKAPNTRTKKEEEEEKFYFWCLCLLYETRPTDFFFVVSWWILFHLLAGQQEVSRYLSHTVQSICCLSMLIDWTGAASTILCRLSIGYC